MLISVLKANNLDLAKQIRKTNKIRASSEDAYCFIISALKILHPEISILSLIDSITDDENDNQIDAIVIENNIVNIYDFKMSEGFKEKEIRLFAESIDELIFTPDSDISDSNDLIKKKIYEARNSIDKGHKVNIRVVRGGNHSLNP